VGDERREVRLVLKIFSASTDSSIEITGNLSV
jgi:hypothetical protein